VISTIGTGFAIQDGLPGYVQKVTSSTKRRTNTMKGDIILCDEETFCDELSDATLEIAAGKYWEVANPFTIAFCSGLDTCPANKP
jgi:hypothetical protein